VEVTWIDIAVDIEPGSCPNPLNVKSKGALPSAVLGRAGFDVTTIDPATIRLSRDGVEGEISRSAGVMKMSLLRLWSICGCHALAVTGM